MSVKLLELMQRFLPITALLAFAAVLWRLLGTWFRRREKIYGRQVAFSRQVTRVFFAIAVVTGIIATAPVGSDIRGQLLGFWGILISATLALSATTFLGNLLAGFMQKSIGNFSVGDFIRAGEHFGRVSERGIFHIEIQTEESQLVTLPNLQMVSRAIEVFPAAGILVSSTVSLGYDVHRLKVEPALIEAAVKTGLDDAFVRIIELGNYAVTYRVSGLLKEVKTVISTRSRLNAFILDVLHERGIEIVSPAFMSQRRIPEDHAVIPAIAVDRGSGESENPEPQEPEQLIFAKAETAEKIESLVEGMDKLQKRIEEIKEERKDADDGTKKKLYDRILRLENWLKILQDRLQEKRLEMDSR